MNRSQLEHLIRSSGVIANVDEIVVVGSQAILGAVPEPPAELTQSMEADVFPLTHPERSDLIDGAIGEGSIFHDTHGYYAQGVSPRTAILPRTWRSRLVEVSGPRTQGVKGWCLDPHDLALSKYAAGRPKDRDFNRVLIQHGYVGAERLAALLLEMPLEREHRDLIEAFIRADFEQFAPPPP